MLGRKFMSYVFKKCAFRDDVNVEFYKSSAEFNEYVKKTYIDTGKIISWRLEKYIDIEKQFIEYETIYKDKQSFDEASEDTMFYEDSINLYEYSFMNGIRLIYIEVDSNTLMIECDPIRGKPVEISSMTN